jgi:hypothetical protein
MMACDEPIVRGLRVNLVSPPWISDTLAAPPGLTSPIGHFLLGWRPAVSTLV